MSESGEKRVDLMGALEESIAAVKAAQDARQRDESGYPYPVPGVTQIALERNRQITAEGWTREHDDEHTRAELATAAVGYAMFAVEQVLVDDAGEEMPEEAYDTPPSETEWPWHPDCWKPSTDPIRNLVKAGALIAAEIDRIERVRASGGRSPA